MPRKLPPPGFPPNVPYWTRPKGGGGRRLSMGVPVIPPFPPEPPVDPLSIFDDDFAGPTLNSLWEQFLPDLITLSEFTSSYRFGAQDGGIGGSHWFDARTGVISGPMITGDAIMRTRMIVRNYAGDGPPPLSAFRIAGISLHDPAQPPYNYCHVGIGCLVPEDGPDYRIESKNNQDDVSNYITQSWPVDVSTELALQIVGQTVTYAARIGESDDYTILRIIDRDVDGPPLPSTLWWGLIDYSDQAFTDISCTCEWARFQTPGFNGGLMLPTS